MGSWWEGFQKDPFFCLIMIGKAEYLTWGEGAEEDRENDEK
jgi:hypothetical protein